MNTKIIIYVYGTATTVIQLSQIFVLKYIIHYSKDLQEHRKTHQISIGKKLMLFIYIYLYGLGNVFRTKGCHTSFDENENDQSMQG